MKNHVKCVLKTEKPSFDRKFLLNKFNIYFIYSPLMHKIKIYFEKLRNKIFCWKFSESKNSKKGWKSINLQFCLKWYKMSNGGMIDDMKQQNNNNNQNK